MVATDPNGRTAGTKQFFPAAGFDHRALPSWGEVPPCRPRWMSTSTIFRTFSQDVGTGPFSVSNVPMISGAGNAELVIRDAAGHETGPPRHSMRLLTAGAGGLSSWSVEAGLPRLSYVRRLTLTLNRRSGPPPCAVVSTTA